MEKDILKTLNFQLVQPTTITFLLRFVKLSTTLTSGVSSSIEQQLDLLSKVRKQVEHINYLYNSIFVN